ncbi:hypothetical protein SCHPADRAFT_890212 [Schizopora paradoxa]|uniref:DUF6533 domain-containing protein n=1 Tax=Schizopora paradoxa TaxID=27342 RepID=A0A0H2RMW9_9AGAM|nr:hypothetical protein SCHPADRAFT_890212 [Schizopora paradoxa]
MSATGLDPAQLNETSLGFLTTKQLALSSLALLIYDHCICLSQEVEYFWYGDWNLTRTLYFLNRYIPPWVFLCPPGSKFFTTRILRRNNVMKTNSSRDSRSICNSELRSRTITSILIRHPSCTHAIRTTSSFVVIGMIVVEAVLVIRVYYLWSHNGLVQRFVVIGFVSLAAVALGFAANAISALSGINLPDGFGPGCFNSGKGLYWPIFLPTFIIQTFLFAFTLLRIVGPLRSGQSSSFVKLLLRDGGYFYLVVILSVGYTGIGSLELSHPLVSTPALLSNSLLAIHSVCASHLILSVQSLASYMGSDPVFLLSNIEMARVHWRRGSNVNELVVEVDNEAESADAQQPMELQDLEYVPEKRIILPRTVVQTLRGNASIPSSRVGILEDTSQPSRANSRLSFSSYAFLDT